MVYAKKGLRMRKNAKRKGRSVVKRSIKRAGISKGKSSLVSLIKKVALKQTETKYNHYTVENIQLNHNSGNMKTGLLYCTQGITDTGTGSSAFANRVGDEIIARGISIKLWIANKLDRPNVMYRLIVFKYQAMSVPTSSALFKGAIGNKIMDDLDKEYITPVYQKIFNLQVGYSAAATATAGDTDGKEAHRYLNVWIPLKDKKIHYVDGGSLPKFIDYGFYLIPYDSYGTLITDVIASYSYQYKLYFKDP